MICFYSLGRCGVHTREVNARGFGTWECIPGVCITGG